MSSWWGTKGSVGLAIYPEGVYVEGCELPTEGMALGLHAAPEGLIVEGFKSEEEMAEWLELQAHKIRTGRVSEGDYEEADE